MTEKGKAKSASPGSVLALLQISCVRQGKPFSVNPDPRSLA